MRHSRTFKLQQIGLRGWVYRPGSCGRGAQALLDVISRLSTWEMAISERSSIKRYRVLKLMGQSTSRSLVREFFNMHLAMRPAITKLAAADTEVPNSLRAF